MQRVADIGGEEATMTEDLDGSELEFNIGAIRIAIDAIQFDFADVDFEVDDFAWTLTRINVYRRTS